VRPARLSDDEPESAAEAGARAAVEQDGCPGVVPFLFPGIAQVCQGRPAEGAAIASLGVAELAAGAAVTAGQGIDHPGAAVSLVALQDLYIAGVSDYTLERQRAAHLRYVPPERLTDLLPAPFSPDVLLRPEVWLGLIGMFGADLLVTRLVAGQAAFDFSRAGTPPNLFGRPFAPLPGALLATGVGGALFTHVAIAEESFFRGWLQSSLSRALGETPGWLVSTGLFGATHAVNALFMPEEDRLTYLAIYVPFITALGGYLGWVYQRLGYSLGPVVALHFWYDLLVSAFGYALDPPRNPLSASIRLGF